MLFRVAETQRADEHAQMIQVYKVATNKSILDLSYNSYLDKMTIIIVSYLEKVNGKSVSVRSHMDIPTFRAVANEIKQGTFPVTFPATAAYPNVHQFLQMKGSPSTKRKSGFEARHLQILFHNDSADRKYPWSFKIKQGEGGSIGQKSQDGRSAVKLLTDKPVEQAEISLSTLSAKELAGAGLDFILAKEIAEHIKADSFGNNVATIRNTRQAQGGKQLDEAPF